MTDRTYRRISEIITELDSLLMEPPAKPAEAIEVWLIKQFVARKEREALTERLSLVYHDLLMELEEGRHLEYLRDHGEGSSRDSTESP